jgi:hypothetical protein
MHRSSVAEKQRSASGTLQDGNRNAASLVAYIPPPNAARSRSKEIHPRNRRALDFLDPTETDVTETTVTLRSEEIVEQTNYLTPPSSPQLLMENMIHRLREVTGNDLEVPIVHPAIAAKCGVNSMTISKMTLCLRRANHSLNERIVLRSTGRWNHYQTDLVALRRPCPSYTARTVGKDRAVEYSIHRDRTKSSVALVADHTSQIPFSELIDRLHRVNKEITTEPKLHLTLQQKSKISITNSDDDLARILHQVNRHCASDEDLDELGCDVHRPPPIVARSLDRESQQSIMEYLSSNNSSWIEEECGTATSSDYIAFATAHGKHTPAFGAFCSHLAEDEDDDSGCSLHACALSCESSVTWYEGTDIDEILLDDDISGTIDPGIVDDNSFAT